MATPPRSQKNALKEAIAARKWFTLLALPILLFATVYSVYSIWGLLFIYWGASAILSDEVYLVERIERLKNPILFWMIAILWLSFGVMYLLADLFPNYWLAITQHDIFLLRHHYA